MRLLFAGTPEVAVTALRAILASRHTVEAVLTRPDAPAGRGRRVEPSPVAALARSEGIELLTPQRPRERWFLDRLREIAPDCCPVAAYGGLLPQEALDIPPHGWVNLHFSVLPAWRGAAPVQHAIMHGDDITGATTFRLVADLDAGPVYGVLTETVRPDDTSGDLLGRLAADGARLLVDTLDGIEEGSLRAVPQPAEGVSLAPKLTPADARVDWKLPAHIVDRLIRACTPDPGAWTEFEGGRMRLWPLLAPGGTVPSPGGTVPSPGGTAPPVTPPPGGTHPVPPAPPGPPGLPGPGELLIERGAVYAGTGSHPVRLGDVQPPGKRRMPAADWARGLRGAQATSASFG